MDWFKNIAAPLKIAGNPAIIVAEPISTTFIDCDDCGSLVKATELKDGLCSECKDSPQEVEQAAMQQPGSS